MRRQLVDTVSKIIEKDSKTVLILCDIGINGFRETFKNFPKRIYNIGVLEQTTISLAAGLSLDGMIPIVHTIAPFLIERSYEQIKIDLCYQELGSNLISVGASYDYAALGCTHHCPADVNIVNEIPNTEIIVPGHPKELDRLLSQSYNNNKTTYLRISSDTNKLSYDVNFKKNFIVKNGKKLLVIAVGPILQTVLNAIGDLDVDIVYCTTVKPFDIETISHLQGKKTLIIEPYYNGAILNNIVRQKHDFFEKLRLIGVANNFINKYGTKHEIDEYLGLDELSIRNAAIEFINE